MRSIGLGRCLYRKNLMAKSPVIIAVGLWACFFLIAAPARALDPPGDLPADLQEALSEARDAAEDLEYLRAATILADMPLADYDAATRTYIFSMLALYHAKAFEFGEEDEGPAVEYLVKVFLADEAAGLPEEFSTTFADLVEQARREAEQQAAEANTPPRFTEMPQYVTAQAGRKFSLDIWATDPEGDLLTLSCRAVPSAEFLDGRDGTGKFTYVPGFEAVGRQVDAWFFADDGRLKDSALVVIDIREAAALQPSRVVRSFLVPGWGQYSSGHRGIGAALFIGQVAALGAGLVFTSSYNSKVDDYNAALSSYQNATDSQRMIAAWEETQDGYQSVTDAENLRNTAYIVAGAIYAVNVIHAVLAKPPNSPPAGQAHTARSESILYPEVKLGPNRVSLCWKW